ncbi:MAG: YkgJ family cysteine cluster protein [Planctomycetota bacterium]|jgi:Fe-S-cluster containining protein
MNADATRRLRLVYAELDGGIASLLRDSGGACRACGRCCTFPTGSPVLYATALEREYLASGAARTPRKAVLGALRRSWRPGGTDGACPYLDVETKRCTARERRTVGCRTHFCAEAVANESAREAAHALAERALAEIRRIAGTHGIEWDYAPVVERLRGG